MWSSPSKSSQITKGSSAYHNACLGPWELSRPLAEKRQLLHGGVLGPKELTKVLIMVGLALREVRKQHHTTN